MQCRGAIDGGNCILRAYEVGHHALETIHVRADGRNPVCIQAILDVPPLVPGNFGHAKRNEVVSRGFGLRRFGQRFKFSQFLYCGLSRSEKSPWFNASITSLIPSTTVRAV